MDSNTESLVGYKVFAGGPQACVASIARHIDTGDRLRWLACLNPHSYAVASKSPEFEAALKDADWLIPDGVGVVLASRLWRGSIRTRITGSDIFFGVNRALHERGGGKVFFLGSTSDTLERIRRKMAVDFPRLQVAGTFSPPFRPRFSTEELDAMVEAINEHEPDVLWVGMTAPKQETWLHHVRPRLKVKFGAAIGAVFDFYVGRIQRSSPAFQALGLEWLPRLVQEPRRLWRRTFVSAPLFLRDVVLKRPKN